MGRILREVGWEKGKARLYRYGTGVEKRFAVPVLLVYALILCPYMPDLVPNRIAHLQNVRNLCTSRSDRYRRQNRTAGGERSRDRPALGA
jgi:poly(3-hydroxyalkanoate) synthetase